LQSLKGRRRKRPVGGEKVKDGEETLQLKKSALRCGKKKQSGGIHGERDNTVILWKNKVQVGPHPIRFKGERRA